MSLLGRISTGSLALNTYYALAWQGVRVGAQALWLLLIAHKLGSGGYGAFVGLSGLATFLGAFSGMGIGYLLMRAVARDPAELGSYWLKGLRRIGITGCVFAIVFSCSASFIGNAKAPFLAIIAIGATEAIMFPILSFCAFAFNAHERSGYAAGLPAMASTARLIAAAFFSISPLPGTLANYAYIHAIATAIAAILALALTIKLLRPVKNCQTPSNSETWEGIGFAAVWASQAALSSLDKTLVLKLAGDSLAGAYSSAYRLTMIFTLPVDALAMSSLPRVFRHGEDEIAARRLIERLLVASIAYSIIAAVLLYAAAPMLAWLLGPTFKNAVPAARMMIWLLPAYSARMLASNIILGLNGQWMRLSLECLGILTMCISAYLFIPKEGLVGAVHMIVLTESSLAILTWAAVAWLLRHPNKKPS